MALEKEARTNFMGSDIDRRNRNWDKLDDIFTNLIKIETITGSQVTIENGGFLAGTINYSVPAGYKMIGYTVSFSNPMQSTGHYSGSMFRFYHNNHTGAARTGIPFVNVALAKTNYVDGNLTY